MSMFGVPAPCARCKKKVYAAEQKLAEGSSWHNLCWALEFKEREQNKKQYRDATSYNASADVKPSYYRVADVSSGSPARMESSGNNISSNTPVNTPVNTAPNTSSMNDLEVKFCPNCGRKRGGEDKFCAGCGKKLV